MIVLSVVLVVGLVGQAASQCSPSPCGVNTQCDVNPAGAAVCRLSLIFVVCFFFGGGGSAKLPLQITVFIRPPVCTYV